MELLPPLIAEMLINWKIHPEESVHIQYLVCSFSVI